MKRGRNQIPMKSGDEIDAFSPCVFYNNTGIVKKTQRAYNKRVRKQIKQELRHVQQGQI